jgi:hypothetical protein
MSEHLHAVPDAPESGNRKVAAEALAACTFSSAYEYATEYFRRAEQGHQEASIRVPFGFLPLSLNRRVQLVSERHPDSTEQGRPHDEIRIRWTAGTALLPDFHGTVRLRIAGVSTRVLVEGFYHPPLGTVGRLFDRIFGAYVADASVRDLAKRIAAYLVARDNDWRTRVG